MSISRLLDRWLSHNLEVGRDRREMKVSYRIRHGGKESKILAQVRGMEFMGRGVHILCTLCK
jgi:hypothetical protein